MRRPLPSCIRFAILITVSTGSVLSGQSPAQPGSVVRVTADSVIGSKVVGRLVELTADSVVFMSGAGRVPQATRVAFRRGSVSMLEVQQRNVAAGMAIGALTGFAVGFMLASRVDYGDSQQYVTTSSVPAPVVGLLGGGAGAIVGAIVAPPRWLRVF